MMQFICLRTAIYIYELFEHNVAEIFMYAFNVDRNMLLNIIWHELLVL